MQATKGENSGERPMWAEKGGLDFEGRAKWDAWTACKGVKTPKAQLDFVRVRVSCLRAQAQKSPPPQRSLCQL